MTTLRPDQVHDKELCLRRRRHCLFNDTGLGKTLVMQSVFDELLSDPAHGVVGRILVLAPRSVMRSAWEAQWARHGFAGKHGKLSVLWRPSWRQIESEAKKNWRVGVLNVESFRGREDFFASLGVQVLVVDESTDVKNESAKITHSVKKLASLCSHVYLMSGEPSPNDESELYAQITTVAPQAFAPFTNYWSFFRHFFFQPTAEKRIGHRLMRIPVSRPRLLRDKADEFWSMVKPHATYRNKSDVVDMPPFTDLVRHVYMKDRQLEAYTKLLVGLRAEIGDTEVHGGTGAAKVMKLRQVTSGFLYSDDEAGRQTHEIGRAKAQELIHMACNDLAKERLLVWGTFQGELELLANAMTESDVPAAFIHGGVPQAVREERLQAFKDGRLRALVAHPGTMGHGVDGLQHVCQHAVYASLDYSWELHKQSRDRIHRVGQTEPCFCHYLVCPGTIDEALVANLERKYTMTEFCHEALRVTPGE